MVGDSQAWNTSRGILARRVASRVFVGFDTIFALRALGRQFVALVLLIALRRLLWKLRRINRSLRRWTLSYLGIGNAPKKREMLMQRRRCRDYQTFKHLGEQLDALDGLDKWKEAEESPHYDAKLLKRKIRHYESMRASKDLDGCMFALRSELLRKHYGIANPALFEVCQSGTKRLVDKYVSTVCKVMTWVAFSHRDPIGHSSHFAPPQKSSLADRGMSVAQKLAFFNETKHSFGRSALVLSGGASLGMYHVGVIKALHQNGLLPRIIAGASAGSIICGLICTRTDEELTQMWIPGFPWDKHFNFNFFSCMGLISFIKGGGKALYSSSVLGAALKDDIGEYTFLEAYDRTGRICNITVSGLRGSTRYPMILNYLTSPHVLIWSAALASCALPGIFEPSELLAKDRNGKVVPYLSTGLKWQDGSMQSDLPMNRLSELFNVNFFIVSQVNPQARIFSGVGTGSPRGPVFALVQFLLRIIKENLLCLSELVLRQGGRYVSPWLRPAGFSPVALIVQEYTGDITIFNGGGFSAMHTLLDNPGAVTVDKYNAESEWETWWYIPQIKNACAIEFVMDEIVSELRAELLADKDNTEQRPFGQRTPSWSLFSQEETMEKGLKKSLPSFIQVEHDLKRTRPSNSSFSCRSEGGLFASNKSLLNLLAVGQHN